MWNENTKKAYDWACKIKKFFDENGWYDYDDKMAFSDFCYDHQDEFTVYFDEDDMPYMVEDEYVG